LIRTLLLSFISISCWAHGSGGYGTGESAVSMTAEQKPKEFEGVGITEKLGEQVDLSLKVKNEKGETVALSSFFDGTHPVILSPVYFQCPGLCNFHLNGLTDTLKTLDWSIGNKFTVVSLSFDPRETPEMAAAKKQSYLKIYSRPGTENGWHFVTADEATIKAITNSVGFKYKWVPETKEWAHASAAIVLTPDGKISRYLHGILFEKNTIKLALGDATGGRIGSLVDQMVWYCFHYDPHQSKYTLYAFRVMQIAAAIFVLVLAALLGSFWFRARRRTV
jgi:protein SCO1/2